MERMLAEEVRRLEDELRLQRERTASDEVITLRNKLKLAMEADENNKQAMEELALVIKEVAGEANQAKEKLCWSEEEAARLKALIKTKAMEAKKEKETLSNTIDKLQVEAEESLVAWSGKEIEFIKLIKEEEDVKASVVEENRKLAEALMELGEKSETLREETEKLRGVFNGALDEADVAREASEEARDENLQLKVSLAEKERRLAILSQDVERLRVYEAAAAAHGIPIRSLAPPPPPSLSLSLSLSNKEEEEEEELKKEWEPEEEELKSREAEEEQQKPGVSKDEPKPNATEDREKRLLPPFSKRSLLPSFSRKKDSAAVVEKDLLKHAKSYGGASKTMIPLPVITSKTKEVGESTDLRDDVDSSPPLHSRKHRRTSSCINEDKSSSLEEFELLGSPHHDDMEVERAGSHSTKKKLLLWRFGHLLWRKNHHPNQTQTLNHKELTT